MNHRTAMSSVVLVSAIGLTLALSLAQPARAEDAMLLDFENPADLANWSPVTVGQAPAPASSQPSTMPEPAAVPPAAAGTKPDASPMAATAELSDKNATNGSKALKIIFHGGRWPGVADAKLPIGGDWQEFNSIKLDMTADRPTLAGLRITQRKSPEDVGAVWDRTIYLAPGKNEIQLYLKHPEGWGPIAGKYGDVVSLAIYAYRPADGQTLYVDNVRLSPDKPARNSFRDPMWTPYWWEGHSMHNLREFSRTGKMPAFTVSGTELAVPDCATLAAKLKDQWTPPQVKTLEEIEADFTRNYQEIKKDHPKAILAIFRDGQAGFDPAEPEKAYAGWKDAHLDCHGPDGPLPGRETNSGKNDYLEAFMRHRALIAQVDLSVIPKGSEILSAQLLLNRLEQSRDATKMANMWVAEPCMRPWEESEVNGYQYADGKLWKAVSGCFYGQDDPDFLPIFLAHGPAQGRASVWDFTHAVRFWTDGQHANHGFIFHGDSLDYMLIYSRECKQPQLRPALMVIYEPK